MRGGSAVKNLPANAEDVNSIPGSGRSPGGGNGNSFQNSCLENPWTEEPGGLQSMGSQRVRRDRACMISSYWISAPKCHVYCQQIF